MSLAPIEEARRGDIEAAEAEGLIRVLRALSGYDFTGYSRASLTRRIKRCVEQMELPDITALQRAIMDDPDALKQLLDGLSITSTEMFRDPCFFQTLRDEVLPRLSSWPLVKIWLAGCSSGEELYSVAILLREAGLAGRSRIYATDINHAALEHARQGIFPLSKLQRYTEAYLASGGQRPFSDYYTARYDRAIFDSSLREDVVVAHHNLVTDGTFSDMHLIVCRNVLIYFDPPLQSRVLGLFRNSLDRGGYLALGSRETLRFSDVASDFEDVDPAWRIWRLQRTAS